MLYIFDIGGVCTNNAMDGMGELCSILDITMEKFNEYTHDLLSLVSDGAITIKEFWNTFSSRSGIKVNCDWWHCLFHPVQNSETYRIIKYLKDCGNRVVAGTNTIESHYLNHIERGDYCIFDQTYTSIHLVVSKPSPEFWKIIMISEGVKAKDCVFIDDKEENVKAASLLGIKAIHFTDARKLEQELNIHCL